LQREYGCLLHPTVSDCRVQQKNSLACWRRVQRCNTVKTCMPMPTSCPRPPL
jgi:hypothetical protein